MHSVNTRRGQRHDVRGDDGDDDLPQLVQTLFLYNVMVYECELVCDAQFPLVEGESLVLSLGMERVSRLEYEPFEYETKIIFLIL